MRGILLVFLLVGCGWKGRTKKLSESEFDHYYALRVYMEDAQKKAYLKGKTEEERNQYLKEQGLWDRFYQYDAATRQSIVDGDVAVGWTKDMVMMAWGQPSEAHKQPGRKAQRSELWVYRFEQMSDGRVLLWTTDSKTYYKAARLFVREVILDNDVVAEINQKDAHW